MIGRTQKRSRRNRTKIAIGQSPTAPPAIATMSIHTATLQIDTNVPVIWDGELPLGITRQAAGTGPQLLPTVCVQDTPTQLHVTFAGALVVTDVVTINANVGQIRTSQGGYVAAATKTF